MYIHDHVHGLYFRFRYITGTDTTGKKPVTVTVGMTRQVSGPGRPVSASGPCQVEVPLAVAHG